MAEYNNNKQTNKSQINKRSSLKARALKMTKNMAKMFKKMYLNYRAVRCGAWVNWIL